MKRVLFAINNQPAENKLSKLIKEQSQEEQFQVVGTLVSNESIANFLSKKSADILVYTEGLNGKEDGFDYILKLHRQYPNMRIVFIAVQRTVGDKKLATLVAFHIYDIVAGKRILMQDVADKIVNPTQFEDVIMYLPDGNDLLRESDFQPSSNTNVQNAQNESDRVAERAGMQQKLQESENERKSLSIKLSASESRVRDLELEQATWREEASKQRMLYERSSEAEKKALSQTIVELNDKITTLEAEKNAAKRTYDDLKRKYDEQAHSLSLQQSQTGTSLKAMQNDLRVARNQLEEKTRQYAEVKAAYDKLQASLEQERVAIVAAAKAEADKLVTEANQKAEEASKLEAELKHKLALYGDGGFEEYKANELKRLEEERERTRDDVAAQLERCQQLLAKEHEEAQKEKVARLQELDGIIDSKQKDIARIDKRIAEAELEVRKAKQDEIVRMDAAIQNKREEINNIDAKVAEEISIIRQQKMKEIETMDAEIKAKTDELSQLSSEAVSEIEKINRACQLEKERSEKELINEKKRLEADLEAYKAALIVKKQAAEEEFGVGYTFNENDYLVSGTSVARRCVPVMFYSPTPGSGNSTLALNVATYLAMTGHKTIYVELNCQHPTLKENLGIAMMNDSLLNCYDAMRNKKFQLIDQNIITKQKIINLKTSAMDMHMRYPDMLSFLSFSENGKQMTVTNDFAKGLFYYLKNFKHFEYIIFDVPSFISSETINLMCNWCARHIVSVPQDILSMNNIILYRETVHNINAVEGAMYVVNKYAENTVLGNRKIAEICKIKLPNVIPFVHNEMILASYKSVPAILISKTRELVASYKAIADYIS